MVNACTGNSFHPSRGIYFSQCGFGIIFPSDVVNILYHKKIAGHVSRYVPKYSIFGCEGGPIRGSKRTKTSALKHPGKSTDQTGAHINFPNEGILKITDIHIARDNS